MKYSIEEVLQYVREEEVRFISLQFCDVFGKQKNITILPSELERAFAFGISIDASSIAGFGDEAKSDLLLIPDPQTLMPLPWRPESGNAVRMLCSISYPDGTPFECDTRRLLKEAIAAAKKAGFAFSYGAEQEFYLFTLDDKGKPTKIPCDEAGYMDVAPDDCGENIRREICLNLEQMGILPESLHHEDGPGQNEIDFRYSDALTAADNAQTFQTIVKTVARRNGFYADFSPKPLENAPGNGFHINVSVKADDGNDYLNYVIAGILEKAAEMTAFLNPTENSYSRFGQNRAPGYISWSSENRSQLVRIPAAVGEYKRAEFRSPDPAANPYIAFALLIYAGLYGIENHLQIPEPANFNLYKADPRVLKRYAQLPQNLSYACSLAESSEFIASCIPKAILDIYCSR